MVALSDYLGFLMTEIARARLTSDLASIELAKVYSENELLKNLTVPRVRLARVDLNVPLVVESLKVGQATDFNVLAGRDNVSELNRILTATCFKYFDVRFSKEESKNITARIQLGMDAISQTKDYQEGRNSFEQFTEETFLYAVNLRTLRKLPDFNTHFDQAMNDIRRQYLLQFDAVIKPGPSRLEAMMVNPETAAIRTAHPPQSVFVLNLSLTEEGIELITVQDSEGNTKKVLAIE